MDILNCYFSYILICHFLYIVSSRLQYSQLELAEYLNLHRNTLSRAENGKNITLLSLLELAETLEIDLVDLFVDFE